MVVTFTSRVLGIVKVYNGDDDDDSDYYGYSSIESVLLNQTFVLSQRIVMSFQLLL